MANQNVEHPGELVRRLIGATECTQGEVAEALGVSRQQLLRVLAHTAAISTEMAIRLWCVFPGGENPRGWLRRQAEYDLEQVDEAAIKKETRRLK